MSFPSSVIVAPRNSQQNRPNSTVCGLDPGRFGWHDTIFQICRLVKDAFVRAWPRQARGTEMADKTHEQSKDFRALRSRFDRRTLLKGAGAAAGAPVLAAALPGIASASGVAGSAASRHSYQDASQLIVGISTDIDHLDPRQTNTQEGYFCNANVYDCLVLYELGSAKLR